MSLYLSQSQGGGLEGSSARPSQRCGDGIGQRWADVVLEPVEIHGRRGATITQTGSSGPAVDGMTRPLATYAHR
jgi:hypothetical protein